MSRPSYYARGIIVKNVHSGVRWPGSNPSSCYQQCAAGKTTKPSPACFFFYGHRRECSCGPVQRKNACTQPSRTQQCSVNGAVIFFFISNTSLKVSDINTSNIIYNLFIHWTYKDQGEHHHFLIPTCPMMHRVVLK